MGIGVGVFFLAVGAILAFAVDITTQGIDLAAVGVILMILGAVALLANFLFFGDARRPFGRTLGDTYARTPDPRVGVADPYLPPAERTVNVVEERYVEAPYPPPNEVVTRRRIIRRRGPY